MIFSGIRNLLSSLFQSEAEKTSNYTPTTHYDSTLIDSFLDDHQKLLGIYSRMVEAVQKKDHKRFHIEIQDFGTAFRAHIRKEQVKFYFYIQEKHKRNQDLSKRIIQFRTEMEGIVLVINRFVNTYNVEEQTDANWAALPQELSKLAGALSKRLHDEETELYAMYTA